MLSKNGTLQRVNNSLIRFVFLFTIILPFAYADNQDHAPKQNAKYKFESRANILADTSQAIEQAIKDSKPLLLVAGANWCHDSRGLIDNFSTQEMQAVLTQKYNTLFLDVGYLNDLRPVLSLFYYPQYFSTPTVLIVDPTTRQITNLNTIAMWGDAASIEQEDYLDYFANFESNDAHINMEHNIKTNETLARFQQQSGQKLQQGYALLGPLLAQDKADKLDDKADFYRLWKAVRKYRIQLQKDVFAMHNQVAQSTSPNASLTLPQYDNVDWFGVLQQSE